LAQLRRKSVVALLSRPIFTAADLAEAKQAAEAAIEMVEHRGQEASVDSGSLSMR